MAHTTSEAERLNQDLRSQFQSLKLDPFEIIGPSPHDMALENRQLSSLLEWVAAYRLEPSREALEARGMPYPPVDPGYGPDEDWHIFERWVRGEPTSWTLDDLPGLDLPPPDQVTEEEAAGLIDKICDLIEPRGAVLGINEGVPDRLAYAYLLESLTEDPIPITGGSGFMILSGCTGYCPGCFQRPWCDTGKELNWKEDEEAGGMAVPAQVMPCLPGLREGTSFVRYPLR